MGLRSLLRSLFAHRWSLSIMANPNYELQLTHLLQPGVSEPLDPRRSFSITGLEGCYLNGDLRLYECVITDLWLYKRANLSNHEYIVLKVRYNARDIGFLRVERTIDRSEANGSSWTISTISSTSSTASASSSFAIPAKDIITLCTTENRNLLIVDEEQIAHATLDPPPTLAAVVAACLVVNREKPFYELLTGQCYWFAGVVIRLICDDHTNMQPVPSATRKEGEWRNFLGVMSDARMNEKAKKLRSGYRATLTTLRDQATSRARVPQEAERRVEEADRRAEEERRQREEAERQREEEKRQREEAERQREEERRQREEERRQREEAERRAEEAERKAEDFQRMYKDCRQSGSSTAAALAAAATTNCHWFYLGCTLLLSPHSLSLSISLLFDVCAVRIVLVSLHVVYLYDQLPPLCSAVPCYRAVYSMHRVTSSDFQDSYLASCNDRRDAACTAKLNGTRREKVAVPPVVE